MAVTVNRYNKTIEFIGDNTIDLDTDNFFIALMDSNHVFTAMHTQWSDVSANQLATANGYTAFDGAGSGEQLASVTWTESGGTLTWDAADVSWTASGGSIAADDAVIIDDSATNDEILYSLDFGGTQTATDGGTFNINWNASGIFTIP